MPRVTLNVPGTLPSRSRSRGSRRSTSTTSGRPASLTASPASISSISRLAASTIDFTLLVIFCGTAVLQFKDAPRARPKPRPHVSSPTPDALPPPCFDGCVAGESGSTPPMLARLSVLAALLLLLASCAAVPGYSPPPLEGKKPPPSFGKALESGDVDADGRYEMSATERQMDCKRLAGSIQIGITRHRDAIGREEPSTVSSTAQKMKTSVFGGSASSGDRQGV